MWRLVRSSWLALVLTGIGLQSLPAAAADAAKLLGDLEASPPSWLPALDKCPADVMPARQARLDYAKEPCAAAPDRCLRSCQAGDANDCYAAALVLQEVRDNQVSEGLFLRACALGITSGCTNRAAGMDRMHGEACPIRTYQKACDLDDPWACT